MVIWITGLSGAGKTPLCEALFGLLKPRLPELLVLDGDGRPTLDDIIRVCREKLSSPKVPRKLVVVDAIPKTMYGKPDRKAIKDRMREIEVGGDIGVRA